MVKQNGVYPYTAMLFSLRKEGSSATWMTLGDKVLSGAVSKPVARRQMLRESTQ